ncbi:NAD-dependent protein deacylase [Lactobacillus salsicarnum]|uniref:protein acetyllysine N-acetyltransferase n=1 Tax=Companilactobacillus mishanensis TaxID=2486008 RepID=A0A5P0ZH07_9LACO|nr:NAD-dependent protein deacylase [Companilactobacillus mishanensis]MQS44980.1 NAD-dependent protein deacylase [Companilactobacillus mishanensis]MQS52341.1 NAD-dependent protein deacylase [Companilactobacillus mishanensis]
MSEKNEAEKIEELKGLIENANYVTFLTGAGVSVPSGIPDYRSKGGLYKRQKYEFPPEYMLSHDNLIKHPDIFHQFVVENMYFPDAEPNIIHTKMAEISNEKGTIVTQNVDKLHTKAGAKHVVEFHGNLYDNIHCLTCGKEFDYKEYIKDYRHHEDDGIIRPGTTVLYGEGINPDNIENAVAAIENADLIVVVGTSFKVYPFAGLLSYKNANTKLVAVNKENLDLDSSVLAITDDATNVFEKL